MARVTSIQVINAVNLGNLIFQTRRDQGMTPKEFAKRTTLADDTILQLEKGYSRPTGISLWVLVAIADALNLKVDALVEAACPGYSLYVRPDDVIKARETVIDRLQRHSRNAVKQPTINRYGGQCTACGDWIEAGGGLLGGTLGAWTVTHMAGECTIASTPAPATSRHQVVELMTRVRTLDEAQCLIVEALLDQIGA